ncbi:MAG: hypothetical protein ACFFEV_03410 [Candidatus Thorarchaeota archaeon]
MQGDPLFDALLNHYRDNMSKKYELTGMQPTSDEFASRTASFLHWNMVVAIITEALERAGHQKGADEYTRLLQPSVNIPGNGLSHICNQLLSMEDYLTPQIQSSIRETNEILSMISASPMDSEETGRSLRDLFKFGSNNPDGIRVKLLD